MKRLFILSILFAAATAAYAATTASSVTQNHITWTFDKAYPIGQFVNGDTYVIGPVKIIAITNDLSDMSFHSDAVATSGSMVNPVIPEGNHAKNMEQGYDERLNSYVPALNASRPNGAPVAKDNPLELKPDQSLVSVVSWLWRSMDDREAGAPRPPPQAAQAPGTGGGRPTTRVAAVLTCLAKAPPEGTFRPAYAGNEKRLFNVKQLRLDLLRNLAPVGSLVNQPYDLKYPNVEYERLLGNANIQQLVYLTSTFWLDHIPTWYGMQCFHPSHDMPNYGREKGQILSTAILALHLDWSKIEGQPDKMPLLINVVQLGIDFAGIADAGGFWHTDGGHGPARKPTILFAGLLLDDKHMMSIGQWKTEFHDDGQIFYVTEEHVKHDEKRMEDAKLPGGRDPLAVYTREMIGMPEWSFRASEGGSAVWNLNYRNINNSYIPAFALGLALTGDDGLARKLWNHEAYFEYADRVMARERGNLMSFGTNNPVYLAVKMWDAYRDLVSPKPDASRWYTQTILDGIDVPGFVLWTKFPRNRDPFGYAPDAPVNVFVNQPADLSYLDKGLTTASAVHESDFGKPAAEKEKLAIKATSITHGDQYIEFTFAERLKPGRWFINIDEETYNNIRSTKYGRRLMSPSVTIDVRPEAK